MPDGKKKRYTAAEEKERNKRRAAPGRQMILKDIPAGLKAYFKAECVRKGVSMVDVICALMRAYIDDPKIAKVQYKDWYRIGGRWVRLYHEERPPTLPRLNRKMGRQDNPSAKRDDVTDDMVDTDSILIKAKNMSRGLGLPFGRCIWAMKKCKGNREKAVRLVLKRQDAEKREAKK